MKQSVQNSRILRTVSGRLLTLAVVAAVAFAFTTKADPGQGAIVTHIDRELAGQFTAISPDGQLRLDVEISGQSDYLRRNPDGTLTWQTVEAHAPMTLSVPGGGGVWEPMLKGYGTLAFHALVDDNIASTGEATYLAVQGQFVSVENCSKFSVVILAIIQDQEFKVLKVEIQPK